MGVKFYGNIFFYIRGQHDVLEIKVIWETFYEKTGLTHNSFFYSLNFKTLLWCMKPTRYIGRTSTLDGISPKILKEIVEQISMPLAHVFNMSLQEGIVPLEWKEANIIPLFKKAQETSL